MFSFFHSCANNPAKSSQRYHENVISAILENVFDCFLFCFIFVNKLQLINVITLSINDPILSARMMIMIKKSIIFKKYLQYAISGVIFIYHIMRSIVKVIKKLRYSVINVRSLINKHDIT